MSAAHRLSVTVDGVRESLEKRQADAALPIWSLRGTLGPHSPTPRALDLIDLAATIYRVETDISRRSTDPVLTWNVAAPVRDLDFWREEGGALLARTLEFMTRARWVFKFSHRKVSSEILLEVGEETAGAVLLLSGGVDSCCGAGAHKANETPARLVSFYHREMTLQQTLASELGYDAPIQWRMSGVRGRAA